MNELSQSTPLYIHTLDTLLSELISGRTVTIDEAGTEFGMPSLEARSLLDWYRINRVKWTQPNRKEDVEALVDQLKKTPPELPHRQTAPKNQPRVLHLKSMRAHRFAGIHPYGTVAVAPDDFSFDFTKPVTLIEGTNGAGKTSLLSAIVWCLTGQIYRSQRPPESVEHQIPLETVISQDTPNNESAPTMTAVTPLPSAEVLDSLRGQPLPLDTWVELSFIDDQGKDAGQIRRYMQRIKSGKVQVIDPDFSPLGLDPIAREVGTIMPGQLPYIQLDAASGLGKAVAALTGIKPLEDLAKHAEKSQAKLRKDLIDDRTGEIHKLDGEFLKARNELETLSADHPAIKPQQNIPMPTADKSVEEQIKLLQTHFETLQSESLSGAQKILGPTFDHADPKIRKDLIDNVGPVLGLLETSHLGQLDSAKRLSGLHQISDDDLDRAEARIQQIVMEVTEIVTLAEKPELADRMRLYARIGGWFKGLPRSKEAADTCPVCQDILHDKRDSITGKPIAEHIRECLVADQKHLEDTLQSWEENRYQAWLAVCRQHFKPN